MSYSNDEVLAQIRANTVLTKRAQFEEHPEAYRPRIFVSATQGDATRVIELLQDGQAVTWPSLPNRETCGFDYWHLHVAKGERLLDNVTMIRQSHYPPATGGEPDAE